MGVAAGLVGRLGVGGTADGYVEGFRSMAFAALLIGFARGDLRGPGRGAHRGHHRPRAVHPGRRPPDHPVGPRHDGGPRPLVHLPVPSTSGQAVLTMPLLVPLSDLIGLSRQVTVLAYQYGAGLCELLTPTNGALMAMLAASGVRFEDWLRFVVPVLRGLVVLAAVAIGVAVAARAGAESAQTADQRLQRLRGRRRRHGGPAPGPRSKAIRVGNAPDAVAAGDRWDWHRCRA